MLKVGTKTQFPFGFVTPRFRVKNGSCAPNSSLCVSYKTCMYATYVDYFATFDWFILAIKDCSIRLCGAMGNYALSPIVSKLNFEFELPTEN